ncbi:sugar ABC transporter substrate-binding protein [Schaalia hyovaginalis]|uniref:ABC transporter substrate-binding protein n=1 Tax=Schaalia hyovaginalis TaxID=29316 RepID=UPI0026EBDEF2|nr:sugar ABC transporter substrate-binding protein [Schaalia hyovaginalis]MDD7553968.1 sugar ABC transporter substrate-binding protein [Schaalia hyovaginalis]MDY3094353.1 sugar ABC transporter substrate-binding protein [Schaalia hyovaginalis]
MSLRRTACLALASALALGATAGCSAGGSADRAEGSVTWSTWGNPEELAVFEEFNKDFMERHPDIRVDFQPVASYTDYHSKLTTQLTSGTAPDVFYVGDDRIASLVANKVLEPLDPHLSEDAAIKLDDFSERIYRVAQLDGSTYALPNDVNPDAFWYDKQALAQAGITEDPAELAAKDQWTTQAFFSMTRKLAEAGMTGAAFWNYWSTTNSIIESQAGPVYTDNAYTANTNPAAVEAVQQWADRFASGELAVADLMPAGQDADTLFVTHQLGFLVQGRYTVATIEGAGNSIDDYDVVRWPTPDGTAASTGVASSFLAINKNAADKKAAFTFFSEFLSRDGQTQRLSNSGNALPSIAGVDEIVTGSGKPAHVATLIDMRDEGFANYQVEAVVPDLSNTIANDYMLPIYQGKLTAQEGLDAIAKIVKESVGD